MAQCWSVGVGVAPGADRTCNFGTMHPWRPPGVSEEMIHGYMINYDAGKRMQSPGPEPPRRNATDAVEHPDLFRLTLALLRLSRACTPASHRAAPRARACGATGQRQSRASR